MRNEIKIPVDKNFVLNFENWKDFKNKISKPYENRFVNSIYFDDDKFVTAQNNLSGISERIGWLGKTSSRSFLRCNFVSNKKMR